MKIHEYQAKEIFARYGIPIPSGEVVSSPEEAAEAARRLGGRVVVKAQVHAGGRGKGGGIRIVNGPEEAKAAAADLIGQRLVTPQTGPDGVPVEKLLVEEAETLVTEFYLSVTVDRNFRGPVFIASASGGMDIEQVAAETPSKIHTEGVDPLVGLQPFQGRRICRFLELPRPQFRTAVQIMEDLYRVFTENDCSLVEVNPLAVNSEGRIFALDAKINLEDDALARHPKLRGLRDPNQEDPLEAQAQEHQISYVKLDGDVACLVNGAGLAMATMDVVRTAGGRPANFLDVGGGASEEKVAQALGIMLSDPQVKSVLVNIFGGILHCDLAARGIVQGYRDASADLPLLVRMLGTNVEEGKAILKESGLNVTFAETLAELADCIRDALSTPNSPGGRGAGA